MSLSLFRLGSGLLKQELGEVWRRAMGPLNIHWLDAQKGMPHKMLTPSNRLRQKAYCPLWEGARPVWQCKDSGSLGRNISQQPWDISHRRSLSNGAVNGIARSQGQYHEYWGPRRIATWGKAHIEGFEQNNVDRALNHREMLDAPAHEWSDVEDEDRLMHSDFGDDIPSLRQGTCAYDATHPHAASRSNKTWFC